MSSTALKSRRRAALAPLLALGSLGALGVTTSGCSMAPVIEAVSQDGHEPRPVEPFDWPRPIRVGVLPNNGGHTALHDRVMRSLTEGIDRVIREHSPSSADRVDYVLDVEVGIESGGGHGSNFFAVFPGFVIFMPSWYQLRWDFGVMSHVTIYRGDDHVEVRRLELHDRFVVHHTPVGISVGAYIGWGGIIFLPLVISPLVTGIVAAADDWDARRFGRALATDPEAGVMWGTRIARAIRDALDAELHHDPSASAVPTPPAQEPEAARGAPRAEGPPGAAAGERVESRDLLQPEPEPEPGPDAPEFRDPLSGGE